MQIQTQDDVPAVEATPAAAETPEHSASPETTGNDDEPQPPKPEKPDGVQKRINELTAKARAAERRAEILERQLEANQRQQAPSKEEPAAPQAKPSIDQYESYDDYVEALADWKTDQKLAARDKAAHEERTQSKQKESRQQVAERVQKQIEDGRGKYSDFDEKVMLNPDLPITASMVEIIADIEAGADITYYLADHPEEAADIASMSPTRQAIALGRIEATLSATKSPAKTVSSAPAPVGSQLNGGQSPGKADPSKMTDAEWAKWDAEQQAKKSRR